MLLVLSCWSRAESFALMSLVLYPESSTVLTASFVRCGMCCWMNFDACLPLISRLDFVWNMLMTYAGFVCLGFSAILMLVLITFPSLSSSSCVWITFNLVLRRIWSACLNDS